MKSCSTTLGAVMGAVLVLTGCSSSDAPPEPRKATTRPLRSTPTQNVLLDPFFTTDSSLGHFVAFLQSDAGAAALPPSRLTVVSQAPAGVASPILVVDALAKLYPGAVYDGIDGIQIVAPFPGGAAPFDAQIWVSASDASGAPESFLNGALALTVKLLPNDQTDVAYLLVASGIPVELGGRQWVRFALAAPVSLPRGGWFSIAIEGVQSSFQLQAPEVTPVTSDGAADRSASHAHPARTAPRTEGDRRVLTAYPQRAPRPRRPHRP